jgi:hypothetical protein
MRNQQTGVTRMYSPKIDEALVPVLYHLGKARSVRMTHLVDRLLYGALSVEPMPFEAFARFQPYRMTAGSRSTVGQLGTLEELTQLYHGRAAFPFQNPNEIEAWYGAALHGFLRTMELAQDITGEDASRESRNLLFFKNLVQLRQDAHRHLETRNSLTKEAPPRALQRQ